MLINVFVILLMVAAAVVLLCIQWKVQGTIFACGNYGYYVIFSGNLPVFIEKFLYTLLPTAEVKAFYNEETYRYLVPSDMCAKTLSDGAAYDVLRKGVVGKTIYTRLSLWDLFIQRFEVLPVTYRTKQQTAITTGQLS